jgi:hypothetical protein
VLKPGSYFASYEWVATKDYDPSNPEHVRIMDEINFGNGLPVFSCPAMHCMLSPVGPTKITGSVEWFLVQQKVIETPLNAGPAAPVAGDADVQRGRGSREARWL